MSKRSRNQLEGCSVESEPNPLSKIPKAPCEVDSLKDLPFIPTKPLPAKSFCMYIVGAPKSGKTNLWLSFLNSKQPRYYRGFFDRIFLVSASAATLPKFVTHKKKGIPSQQIHSKLTDDTLTGIVDGLREDKNMNSLLILDDVIKDINRSHIMSKIVLNRRHCTQNPGKDGQAGMALMIISQKYKMLNFDYRPNCSHFILFKTENAQEMKAIREELMIDLNRDEQDALLEKAWSTPYSFLFVDANAQRGKRYYIRFDPVTISYSPSKPQKERKKKKKKKKSKSKDLKAEKEEESSGEEEEDSSESD
jgi:hypothetical protein